MKSPRSKTQKSNLVVYECRFNLHIQDLQAQMYFPSSFQVQWRTKTNKQLGKTQKFVIKNQQNQVRFDQTLSGSILMVYDLQTESYVQKDTVVLVSYYLNNKQHEVKELGRVSLRMGRFMEGREEKEKGAITSTNGNRLRINSRVNNNKDLNSPRRLPPTTRQPQKYFKSSSLPSSQQVKCMRLQNSQYNAKIKFRCLLTQCKQTNLSIQQMDIEQFSDPSILSHYRSLPSSVRNSLSVSKKVSSQSSNSKGQQQLNDKQPIGQLRTSPRSSMQQNNVNMNTVNNGGQILKKKASIKSIKRISRQQQHQNQQYQGQKTIRYGYDYNNKKNKQSMGTHINNIIISSSPKLSNKPITNTIATSQQQQQQLTKIQVAAYNNLLSINHQLTTQNNHLKQQIHQHKQQHLSIKALLESKHQQTTQKTQQINLLKQQIFALSQQLRQKQQYFLANLQKLQQVDQLRYQLIEVKEYANRLQQRLVVKYNQKPEFIESILRAIQGSKLQSKNSTLKDIVLGYQQKHSRKSSFHIQNNNSSNIRHSNPNNTLNLVSSITIIDQQNSPQKGLSTSVTGKQQQNLNSSYIQQSQQQQYLSSSSIQNVSNIRQSRKHDTRRTIVQNLYNLSSSQIQLTNSQMRQIQGSTVKMVHQLEFMQMELYQVKAQVNFQQQKYQTECIHHQQTKIQLFATQQQVRQIKKELSMLQNQHLNILKHVQKLQQQDQQLNQQLNELHQRQAQLKKQIFLLKQQKEQQQYELNIIIKQQKIQIQSLQQNINNHNVQLQKLQIIITKSNQRTSKLQSDTISLKTEIIAIRKQNTQLHLQLQESRQKQHRVNQYLSNLQHEIQQVYKIVEEKELNEDHYVESIKKKEEVISNLQEEKGLLEVKYRNLQMVVGNCQKQLVLYQQTVKYYQSIDKNNQNTTNNNSNNNNSNNTPNCTSSISKLLQQNKHLILKNKQLISILNKNANTIVQYEKQKKSFTLITNELNEMKQVNKLYEQVKELNAQLEGQNKRLVGQCQEMRKKIKSNNHDNHNDNHNDNHDNNNNGVKTNNNQHNNLLYKLQQYQQQNIQLTQQLNQITTKLSLSQSTLIHQSQLINQLQIKLTKLYKQKKLLQQSIKTLQTRTKSYQSLLMKQQSTIQTNQSVIKQLQTKLKNVQINNISYHLNGQNNNGSLKVSQYDGMSQIKLQSHIQKESSQLQSINITSNGNSSNKGNKNNNININKNNNINNNNNINKPLLLAKQSSLPQQTHYNNRNKKQQQPSTIIVQSLLTQISQLKQQLQTYKTYADISTFQQKKKKKSQQKTIVLIQMMRQYFNSKTTKGYDNTNNSRSELSQLIEEIHTLRGSSQIAQYQFKLLQKPIEQLTLKAQQISRHFNAYKNKLLKDSRNNKGISNSIPSILQPIKPIQDTIKQFIQLTQSISV